MPTLKELKDEAKCRGIRGISHLRKAELMDVLSSPILEDPIPEKKKNPFIKPTQYISPSLKKVEVSVNNDLNKFADWILSYIPEPNVKNVNTKIEQLKEKVKNTIYKKIVKSPKIKNIEQIESGDRVKIFKITK